MFIVSSIEDLREQQQQHAEAKREEAVKLATDLGLSGADAITFMAALDAQRFSRGNLPEFMA